MKNVEQPKKDSAKGAALATTGTTALSTHVDYGDDAGKGYEGQSQADMTIPFLGVLQSNSPQITDREDCKPGMLINTVTEEVVDGLKQGLLFVPALTQHVFVEWKPRDKGGGFVALYQPEADVVTKARQESKEFGKYKTPAGNDLVETFYIYAVLVDEDGVTPAQPVVISFASTKIAVYKRWNTKIKMFQVSTPDGRKQMPPLFAHLTRIKTVKDSNPKGDFFNFELVPAKGGLKDSLVPPGSPLLEEAKGFKKLVEQNSVKLAHDSTTKTEGAETGSETGGRKPGQPF